MPKNSPVPEADRIVLAKLMRQSGEANEGQNGKGVSWVKVRQRGEALGLQVPTRQTLRKWYKRLQADPSLRDPVTLETGRRFYAQKPKPEPRPKRSAPNPPPLTKADKAKAKAAAKRAHLDVLDGRDAPPEPDATERSETLRPPFEEPGWFLEMLTLNAALDAEYRARVALFNNLAGGATGPLYSAGKDIIQLMKEAGANLDATRRDDAEALVSELLHPDNAARILAHPRVRKWVRAYEASDGDVYAAHRALVNE